MAKQQIKVGFTDYTTLIFIPDPASTDGSGKTGLVAANLTVSGTRVETDNDVTVTDYTSSLNNLAALTTAHTDWGLLEVSSTLCPGLYRLDIADAIFAAGAWSAVVYVMITTSAAAASPMEFTLVGFDQNDGVRMGLTALPNAAADAAGGLPISDAGGLDLDARLDAAVSSRMATYTQPTGFLAATFPGTVASTTNITAGTITTVTNLTNAPTNGDLTATMKTSVTTAATAATPVAASVTGAVGSVTGAVGSVTGLTASDVGAIKAKTDNLPTDPADHSLVIVATDAIYARLGAPAGASVSADMAAVKAETATILADTNDIQTRIPAALVSGRIDASVGAMAANVMTAAAAAADLTTELQSGLSTLDAAGVRTAVGLASANLDTQISTLATAANLATVAGYLDTEIAAIKAKTDNLPADPADASDITTSFTTINTKLDTIDDFLDTEVAAIKAKTDNLPATPAATGDAMTLTTGERDSVADALLARNVSGGSSTGRTVKQAMHLLRNKTSTAGGTLTVCDTDDTTTSWTAAVTTTAGNPISAIDPT